MRDTAIFNVYTNVVSVIGDIAYDINGNVVEVDDSILQPEIDSLELEYQNKSYQRSREKEYPNITEQLDMLWHAIDAGKLNKTSDFYTTLKSIKDKYPKSE